MTSFSSATPNLFARSDFFLSSSLPSSVTRPNRFARSALLRASSAASVALRCSAKSSFFSGSVAASAGLASSAGLVSSVLPITVPAGSEEGAVAVVVAAGFAAPETDFFLSVVVVVAAAGSAGFEADAAVGLVDVGFESSVFFSEADLEVVMLTSSSLQLISSSASATLAAVSNSLVIVSTITFAHASPKGRRRKVKKVQKVTYQAWACPLQHPSPCHSPATVQ
jgi:hypothetical protein